MKSAAVGPIKPFSMGKRKAFVCPEKKVEEVAEESGDEESSDDEPNRRLPKRKMALEDIVSPTKK